MSLTSTMRDVKSAPSPHSASPGTMNHHNCPVVNKGGDYSAVSVKFFEDVKHGKPEGLKTPMGTAIDGIGHGYSGGK